MIMDEFELIKHLKDNPSDKLYYLVVSGRYILISSLPSRFVEYSVVKRLHSSGILIQDNSAYASRGEITLHLAREYYEY
jgi:hypothetical protein